MENQKSRRSALRSALDLGGSHMKYSVIGALAALVTTPALAGGIERSSQSMAILFQEGRYLEFGASYARPKVEGMTAPLLGSLPTGDITNSYFTGSISYKADLGENWSYAIILDQPFGADTLYPAGSALAGSLGKINNTMLTAVGRYEFGNGFSAYAGLRSSWTRGEVALPGYTMSTKTDQAFGYLLGVAYEKPEIALRVALTYNSKIKHSFDATENISPVPTTFETNLPESVNLEFQSGVAENTLVFGSVRWVNWKDFVIQPAAYGTLINPTPLVSYDENSITYTLGVGRKFNENWSGSLSFAHDTGNGPITGNLGPIGKRNSIAVGVSYTRDAMTISGGIQYSRIGGVTTRNVGSTFGDNSAIGAGIRVGFRF
jgi:long-subunit fatty acid transport protein